MKNQSIQFSLAELAELTSSQLIGNPQHCISSLSDLENAKEHDASFLDNPRYVQAMKDSKAGVIFMDLSTPPLEGRNFILSKDPSKAFQKVIDLFYSRKDQDSGFEGVHPTAVIHPEAVLGNNVSIAPHAVISKGVKIGDNTIIGAGVFVGAYSSIGTECLIHANVVIREYCEIHHRVILQPGAIIGSCGFGYTTDAKGRHHKVPQTGSVVIEDDVEIGANTTIDRARFTSTRICRGTKIDNLVQIGHNVVIGPDNIIIAQTGVSGSSKTGRNVVLAGQVGVVGHVHIADQTMVAAQSGVTKSILEPGSKYAGSPAHPLNEHHRQHAYLHRIEKYVKKIEELEKRLNALSQ